MPGLMLKCAGLLRTNLHASTGHWRLHQLTLFRSPQVDRSRTTRVGEESPSVDSLSNVDVMLPLIPPVAGVVERLPRLFPAQDVYLHTNCLATLANMAPHAHHLNAYAAQRLVSLFDMLAKK